MDRFKNFFLTFAVVAVVMLADIIGKAGRGTIQEVSAFGSDYLALGYAEGAAFIVVFIYLYQAESSCKERFIPPHTVSGLLYALLVSGARGPLLSLIITLAAITILAKRPHRESRKLAQTIYLIIARAGYLYFNMGEFAG